MSFTFTFEVSDEFLNAFIGLDSKKGEKELNEYLTKRLNNCQEDILKRYTNKLKSDVFESMKDVTKPEDVKTILTSIKSSNVIEEKVK